MARRTWFNHHFATWPIHDSVLIRFVTDWERTNIASSSLSPVWAVRPMTRAFSLACLLAVTAVVMFVALRSPLKDDIAWLLYCARRWIAGRELYVDVIEVNPPLIIWISAIPLTLARWLDVNQQVAAIPFFAAAALGCAWLSALSLRRQGGMFADPVPVFAIMGSVLLLIPAADLGQREHLLAAAFLPYLILFARTLHGTPPRPMVSIAAGVLAAIGCALKPQYGVAFAALEAAAIWRGLRPWRLAPLAAGATLTLYVALVAMLCPAYLRRAVPMALALYGATDVSFLALLRDSATLLAAEALLLFLWARGRRQGQDRFISTLLLTGLIFAACANLVCFFDGKDWFYHRLPATVVTVLGLCLWAADALRNARWPRRRASLAVVGGVLCLFCVAAVQRLAPEMRDAMEPRVTTVARLEALIRLHHARSYIAFSEWIALGFPVVNNTGVNWASRFDSMWALKGEMWRAHIDPAAAREWPVAHWVAHDFIAGCPDIAVVDTREKVNYIAILSASDPSFAKVWSRYKQIVAFDGLTIWKHVKGGCVDPWIAAQAPAETSIR